MATQMQQRSEAIERANAKAPFLRDAMLLHPDIVEVFGERGAEAAVALSLAASTDAVAVALRGRRHRLALAVALGDLSGELSLEQVTRTLSDFADAAIEAALGQAMEERSAGASHAGFAVLALGKLGSRELNYSSDVDLIFLFDPETLPHRAGTEPAQTAVRIGKRLIELLQERTADGYVVRVDMRLRPSPEVTPVALSIDAALSHYETAALPWERAVFIRGRVCAGDFALGERFLAALKPFVWRRSLDFGVVDEIRAISARIRDHYGSGQQLGPGYDLKRGRGGIREVEFFAQIEQLIHAGREPDLRAPATLDALGVLAKAGKIAPDEAAELGEAYRLLRTIEHRAQMVADQQTHLLPADPEALDSLARLHGLADGGALVALLEPHVARVETAFGRQLGDRDQRRLSGDPSTLASELGKLGFADPQAAAMRLNEWRSGRARSLRSSAARDALEGMLAPMMAGIGKAPDPMRALNRLSDLIERLSSGVNLYRLIAARPELGRTLALILGQAPALADQLARRPQLIDGLLDDSAFAEPLEVEEVVAALTPKQGLAYDLVLDRTRRSVNERRFALGVQVVARTRDPLRVATGYADVAHGALRVLADATQTEFARRHGLVPGGELAILGLGRLGGRALTHASDLDLIFLFDAPADARSDGEKSLTATEYYNRLASRIGAALSVPTAAGPLYDVDTRLRPQGAKGLLAVRLDAFAYYQRREAWTFEHMALTRARVLHGSEPFRAAVNQVLTEVLSPRDPAKVISDAAAMRADMNRHKPARGDWDLKRGGGGLVDLEFAIHVRQLTTGVGMTPHLGDALAKLEAAGLAPVGMSAAHDLLTRVLVVLRLVAEDGAEPPEASRDLLAASCEMSGWPALLAAVTAARQEVSSWWRQIRENEA